MSAVVCGKRYSSFFEELNHTPPSKRIRCSASASSPNSIRFSPTRPSPPSLCPPSVSLSSPPPSSSDNSGNSHTKSLANLRSLFPDMEQQLLERALEASHNDLDSSIKRLNDLCLESAKRNLGSAGAKSDLGNGTNVQLSSEGLTDNTAGDPPSENPSTIDNLPTDGSEWVELLVREMMNASDVDDARARASRVLVVLEKSIMTHAGSEAVQSFQKVLLCTFVNSMSS